MKNQKGFSLMELVIVVAIMGILLATTCPNAGGFINNFEKKQMKRHEEAIKKSIKQYYAVEGKFPDDIHEINNRYGAYLNEKKYNYTYQSIDINNMPKHYNLIIGMKN